MDKNAKDLIKYIAESPKVIAKFSEGGDNFDKLLKYHILEQETCQNIYEMNKDCVADRNQNMYCKIDGNTYWL